MLAVHRTVPHLRVFALYWFRIAKYGRCSPCCFTMAMIYLQRIEQKHFDFCLCSCNFQRLLSSLILISTKLVDDQFYDNCVWAQVCAYFRCWIYQSFSIFAQPVLTLRL